MSELERLWKVVKDTRAAFYAYASVEAADYTYHAYKSVYEARRKAAIELNNYITKQKNV
jgi:hypothetical protein